jgi:hypothetical protein
MSLFTITQQDWEGERARLADELKNRKSANDKVAEINLIAPMESFFRVYYCALALATRNNPTDRGNWHRAGFTFLEETAAYIREILLETEVVEDQQGLDSYMHNIDGILAMLEQHLPPEGELPDPKPQTMYKLDAAYFVGDEGHVEVVEDGLLPAVKHLLDVSPISEVRIALPPTPETDVAVNKFAEEFDEITDRFGGRKSVSYKVEHRDGETWVSRHSDGVVWVASEFFGHTDVEEFTALHAEKRPGKEAPAPKSPITECPICGSDGGLCDNATCRDEAK